MQIDIQTERQTERQTDRQTDRQTERKTERQRVLQIPAQLDDSKLLMDRQTNRQIAGHTIKLIDYYQFVLQAINFMAINHESEMYLIIIEATNFNGAKSKLYHPVQWDHLLPMHTY